MTQDTSVSPDQVLALITRELEAPVAGGSRQRLARVRELQRQFRAAPIGGRFVALKRVLYWFTASAFDRQAKVVEALIDAVAESAAVGEPAREMGAPSATLQRAGAGDAAAANAAARPAPGVRLAGLDTALSSSAHMLLPESVLLASLVYGLKPRTCLEIGTLGGGSADIITAAMDDNGFGTLVCVDPQPRIPADVWERIRRRARLIEAPSPRALAAAARAVDEPFGFVLIDGDHGFDGVLADIEGVLPRLATDAHLLFHDAYYHEVEAAIDEALRRYPDRLFDCGLLSVEQQPADDSNRPPDARPVVWGGFRLLRYRKPAG